MLVFQGKDSFLLRYSNRLVQLEIPDGTGGYNIHRLPLGAWWLSHRDRRQHRGVTFRPGAPEVVRECLNMWQGWGVVPKPGDWGAFYSQIAGGGAEAMMWELQRLELDGWHPRDIPQSLLKGSTLQKQQTHTLPPLEHWYLSLLQDGRVPEALINNRPD